METSIRSRTSGAITVLALIFLFVPLAMVVLFSFHSTGGLTFPFEGFSLRWYRQVFDSPEFRDAIRNSLVVGVVTSGITLVLGTMAAYGLARTGARLRGPLALLFFLPITLPGLFIGLSLLTSFSQLEVRLSLTTVTIAHLVYVFPYFLLIALAVLDRLDPALEEAAADLGAGPLLRFRRVTLPQIWPVLAGATCLTFALSFDEFIITFFVIGSDSTLPMYIWSSLRRTIDPSVNAISTMLLAVSVLMFAVAFLFALRGEKMRARATGEEELLA
jgi:spermidine/putrescine transport system permease protein